jgi:hypothetical protein
MNWDRLKSGWEQFKDTANRSRRRLTGELDRAGARAKGRAIGSLRGAAEDLREGAGEIYDDLGRRVSQSRHSTASDVAGGLVLVGLGAGLMYLLDPERGRRRRALVRDQFVHALYEIDDMIGVVSRDLGHRTRGAWAGVWSLPRRSVGETVPDATLNERVRSKLGRFVSHTRPIEVTARAGRVTLSGPILTHEVDGLLAAYPFQGANV